MERLNVQIRIRESFGQEFILEESGDFTGKIDLEFRKGILNLIKIEKLEEVRIQDEKRIKKFSELTFTRKSLFHRRVLTAL
ncbi:MAG: hypothetical protein DRI61_12475 [Chloroflexi bacterium]|nr:MAG: hypothetical protein DRI61_12475 [Chloroflexota bacterium]